MGDRVRGSIPGAGKSISVYNQSPRSTQPGHPFMGRRNEYQPRAVMPCGWGVKAGMVREWVAVKTVWSRCSHGPYLSALAMGSSHNRALYKCPITYLLLLVYTIFTHSLLRVVATSTLTDPRLWSELCSQVVPVSLRLARVTFDVIGPRGRLQSGAGRMPLESSSNTIE